jgi:hypothetical protein
MKKVLVGFQGHVLQIEEPGNDFDIYNGPDATFQWVDGPDNVTLDWTLEYSPSQNLAVWVEREEPPTDPAIARKVAYGEIGDQLDMIYHEVQETGTISATGPWASHITTVKNTLPASSETTIEPLTEEERMALDAVREPSADDQMKLNTEDDPIWKYCTTWWGYNGGDE